jgi:transporter family-2 protein
MAGILIAVISGILMSVQGVFNTQITKTTSTWVTNCWAQLTALVTCLIVWGLGDRTSFWNLTKVEPKYLLFSGVFGAGITFTVMKGMQKLGPASAVILIVTAQILAAYLIELFGMFGVEKSEFQFRKMIGIGIIIAGILLFRYEKGE